MPIIEVFSWDQYTTPAGLSSASLTGNTTPNDPASPGYNSGQPTWVGQTFTFNGGPSTVLDITDDDPFFEDGYVETGAAQTLTQDVTINGITYLAGSVLQNEFSLIDASGQEIYVVRINSVNIGFTYATGDDPIIGETFTAAQGLDGDPADNADGASSSSEPYTDIVCYALGTFIATPSGERRVETLAPGDLITTLDHGVQEVLWVRQAAQPLEAVEADQKPILISKGALGAGCPSRDLIVSPQHRVMVGNGQLSAIFPDEAFVHAKALTELPGIRFMAGKRDVTWVHFACQRHEIVCANGCMSESLLLGAMVLNGMTECERDAVHGIFGAPVAPDAALNGPMARACLTVKAARSMVRAFKEAKRPARAGCDPRYPVWSAKHREVECLTSAMPKPSEGLPHFGLQDEARHG